MEKPPKWAIYAGVGAIVVAGSAFTVHMQNVTQQEAIQQAIASEHSRDKVYLELIITSMQQIQKDQSDVDGQYLQFLNGNNSVAANSFADYLNNETTIIQGQATKIQTTNPYSLNLKLNQNSLKLDYSILKQWLDNESMSASAEEGTMILSNFKHVDSSFQSVLKDMRSKLNMFVKYNIVSY